MAEPDDRSPVARADWRTALAWATRHPARAALVALLLALAGAASVLGFLRWHHAVARWSFAMLCWAVAAVILAVAHGRRRQPKK